MSPAAVPLVAVPGAPRLAIEGSFSEQCAFLLIPEVDLTAPLSTSINQKT